MSQQNLDWLKAMGLGKEDFKGRPRGADPLLWGLKNGVVNEQEYVQWASEYYQLPAIKAEFFSMAVDFTLLEKYADLYDWNPHCYPVYMWEGTLFIACLRPEDLGQNLKSCFVVAPFHALESAWQKHQNSNAVFENRTESFPLPAPAEIKVEVPEDAIKIETQETAESPVAAEEEIHETPQPTPSIELPNFEVPSSDPFDKRNDPVEVQEKPEVAAAAEAVASTETPPLPNLDQIEIQMPEKLDRPQAQKATAGETESPATQETPEAPQAKKSQDSSSPLHKPEAIASLDFSNVDGSEADEITKPTGTHSIKELEDQEQQALENKEVTQTKVDQKIESLTSATATIHARPEEASLQTAPFPDMNFQELSTGNMKLENDQTKTDVKAAPETVTTKQTEPVKPPAPPEPVKAPPTPLVSEEVIAMPPPDVMAASKIKAKTPAQEKPDLDENSLPSLDDLVVHKTDNPPPPPGLENDGVDLKIPEFQQDSENTNAPAPPPFDDDYTPVDFVSEKQKQAHAEKIELEKVNKEKSLTENTITGHSIPEMTPEGNKITEEDLKQASSLEDCTDQKSVVAHLFNHLRRDYKKLMWVNKNDEELYFPALVYGSWRMTELAWKMHVNLSNPNIFRIAYKSGHPFHGEVFENPYNVKYFEWWNAGKSTDTATVFPVIINDNTIGFIVGFGKGEEFDELGSLKKIENLISICKKSLQKFQGSKAA